jgi:putative tryptophan/tyrosine transport system substrate-binding protein
MERREFIALLGVAALTWPLAAGAQQAGKVYRIGYLEGGSSTASSNRIEAFRQGLRKLGWVEGQSIVIDYRFAEGRFDRLPDLAAELVRLKVDIIVAVAALPAAATKNVTATIPIVMIGVTEPVGQGLVASLARPGGNVTGVSFSAGLEIFGKRLELLKQIVPEVRRVAILSNSDNPNQPSVIKDVRAAAGSLGVELQLLDARGPAEFDGAFTAMTKERVGSLLVVGDPVFFLHRTRLVDLAAKSRLPTTYSIREYVDVGGLLSYGPSLSDLWRSAATYVDKILKGAKPADLPVEQPTKFELVVNLKTAKALGLTIPATLLARADEVIE